MKIRDPIHGSIEVAPQELDVIDSPFFQRLRNVKQLGFGDLAFPGATHTRYAHSMGAMHLASRVMDAVMRDVEVPATDVARMRQAVRLAILLHDLGHAPLSHTSEATMPPLSELDLPSWVLPDGQDLSARAAHEHYTFAILLKTGMADVIRGAGLSPEAIVGLIAGRNAPGDNPFQSGDTNWGPLLSSIVSGEMDADRMDYLVRDSFYTGVHYGRYDLDWIIENVTPAMVDGEARLAIHKKAIFAFEDFLLSRYHMFLSVYFHYTSICFDNMLLQYYREEPGEYTLPADPDEYLLHDDVHLMSILRASKNRWAQNIVRRRSWRLLVEVNDLDKDYDLDEMQTHLQDAGIESFQALRSSVLSKYFGDATPTLYVKDEGLDRLVPVADYTPLFERYRKPTQLSRLYCDPDETERARQIVDDLLKGAA